MKGRASWQQKNHRQSPLGAHLKSHRDRDKAPVALSRGPLPVRFKETHASVSVTLALLRLQLTLKAFMVS